LTFNVKNSIISLTNYFYKANKMKKVLILGGGFAGVESAIYLRKHNYDVTLISDREYFYIYPTSIWIPTNDAQFEDVCVDLNDLKKAHGFELIIDSISAIHAKENEVILQKNGSYKDYDYLVVALGSHKMKHQGVENTLSICGAPEMSLDIRHELNSLVAKGRGKIACGFGGNPKDTTSVRGGPGFELLFNIHNMLKKKGIRDNFELTFFAPMAEPGARMGKQALSMMDMYFKRLNIHQHFGKKIKRFEKEGVVFEDETTLEADLTLFIPAGNGHQVIVDSDLPVNEAGFLEVNDNCEVYIDNELSNVYGVGDVAAIEGPQWRAKQGHVAEVMARNTAFNIAARDSGSTKRQGYQEHINIICVMDSGDGAAFVYRDDKRGMMIPMPIIGHWLKKGWGLYCRYSKLGKIPRIPGL
jgi:sulfide:quinone oxidoreductase